MIVAAVLAATGILTIFPTNRLAEIRVQLYINR